MAEDSCFSLNFVSQSEEVYETQDCLNLGDLEPGADDAVSTSDDSLLNSSLCNIDFDRR